LERGSRAGERRQKEMVILEAEGCWPLSGGLCLAGQLIN